MAFDRVQHFPSRTQARAALADTTHGTFARQVPCMESHDWYRPYCFVSGAAAKPVDRYVRSDGTLR